MGESKSKFGQKEKFLKSNEAKRSLLADRVLSRIRFLSTVFWTFQWPIIAFSEGAERNLNTHNLEMNHQASPLAFCHPPSFQIIRNRLLYFPHLPFIDSMYPKQPTTLAFLFIPGPKDYVFSLTRSLYPPYFINFPPAIPEFLLAPL